MGGGNRLILITVVTAVDIRVIPLLSMVNVSSTWARDVYMEWLSTSTLINTPT